MPPSARSCERPGQELGLVGLFAARRCGPLNTVAERQYDDAVFLRPLHQHLAGARRRQQESHRFEQLLLAVPLHAAGHIEAQSGQRGPPQRFLVERQRLLNDRGLRRPDHRQRAAGIEIGSRVGLERSGAAKLDPAPGRGDPRLGIALEQKSLQVGKKALDLLAASAIDEAERGIADRYAVLGIDRVERFFPVSDQLVVGLLDDRLVVPHRLVMRAGAFALAVEIGEPAARSGRALNAAQQAAHGGEHLGLVEIAGFDQVGLADPGGQHGEIGRGAGIRLGRRRHRGISAGRPRPQRGYPLSSPWRRSSPAPAPWSACTPRMTGICAIDLTDLTRRAVSNMSIQIDAAGHTASASGSLPALSASAISSEPWYFTVQVGAARLAEFLHHRLEDVVLRAGQDGELRARTPSRRRAPARAAVPASHAQHRAMFMRATWTTLFSTGRSVAPSAARSRRASCGPLPGR